MKQPFIVAEMSANHLGDLGRALAIVRAAAEAGANAIKIQCWEPNRMVLDRDTIIQSGPWAMRNLASLYDECRTPYGWIPSIADAARKAGIQWFASVFDDDALEQLEKQGCPMYKIASCEIVDLELIKAVARTGKPIIISTGMATQGEIVDAVLAARVSVWHPEITLLKCTAAYPASLEQCNLYTIVDMRDEHICDIGLSDHTLGTLAAVVATTLGATMIEKHLTLRRLDGGPDAGFSSEPHEFKDVVEVVRSVHTALGQVAYGPTAEELHTYTLRRSLHYRTALAPGDKVMHSDITTARPATGLPPAELPRIIGRTVNRAVAAGEPVRTEDFDG